MIWTKLIMKKIELIQEGNKFSPLCNYTVCLPHKRLKNCSRAFTSEQYPIFDLALLLQFCLKILKMYEWLL